LSEELEKLVARQRALLNAIPDLIFRQKIDGTYLDYHVDKDEELALPHPDIIGSNLQNLPLSEEIKAEAFKKLKKSILQGTVEHMEYKMELSGGVRIFEARFTKSGPDEAVCIVRDITEHKKAEEALQNSEANLSALIENTQDMIWSIDPEYRILSTNSAFSKSLKRFGVKHPGLGTKVIGHPIMSKLVPQSIEIEWKEYYDRGLKGERFSQEVEVSRGDKKGYLEFAFSPIHTEDGEIHGLAVFGRDITVHKEIERLKSEFISTMSHELRNPLTSLRGALGLLLSGNFDESTGQELLNLAQRSSERLAVLLDDILDLEKLELNRINFDLKVHKIGTLISRAIQENIPHSNECSVSIQLSQEPPDIQVMADEHRLLQVLGNLLSNAIKFSPPQGIITINTQQEDNTIRVSVSDQGPGIPEDFQSQVFDKFAQAESPDTQQKSGSGLGLHIAKQLMQRMGGDLHFHSLPRQGATFFFELPIHQA